MKNPLIKETGPDLKLINYLLHKIQMQFKLPEDIVIDQCLSGKSPSSGNHIYFINVGYVNVFINISHGNYKQFGTIREGNFFGEHPVLFDSTSRYRI